MLAALVIAFSGTQDSGASVERRQGKPQVAPEHCSARKAVKFYASRIIYWRSKMGAGSESARAAARTPKQKQCPRYLAHVLQRKAYGLRKAYGTWVRYHYHWWRWMPAKLQRVGRCETGGTRGATSAGNFSWDSGVYVSAFGIIRSGYSTFAHRLGLPSWDESWQERNRAPSPREQMDVALALQAEYGWGAWGCGGA